MLEGRRWISNFYVPVSRSNFQFRVSTVKIIHMELSIIILNYNTKDLTVNCINAVYEQYEDELKKGKFEIVLVDNASTDGSVTAIKKLTGSNVNGLKSKEHFNILTSNSLTVIESRENLGFAKGCNLGARKAKGKYLLFLNSDTQIKDKGFLRMLEFIRINGRAGILGGKLKTSSGKNQPSAGKFYTLPNLLITLLGGERLGLLKKSPAKISKADWVSGACLMVKKEVFEKVGGFDEELFMYMEDMELCLKAKRAGYLTYFYPDISLLHMDQGSSNRTFAIIHIYEGILHFYKKYMPHWQYGIAKLMLYSKALFIKNIGKIVHNKYYINTYEEALEFLKK